MLKRLLCTAATLSILAGPVVAHAANDPIEPLAKTTSTVAPSDWTAPSPFVATPTVTDPFDPMTIFPPTGE